MGNLKSDAPNSSEKPNLRNKRCRTRAVVQTRHVTHHSQCTSEGHMLPVVIDFATKTLSQEISIPRGSEETAYHALRMYCTEHLKACSVVVCMEEVPEKMGSVVVSLKVPKIILRSLPLLQVRAYCGFDFVLPLFLFSGSCRLCKIPGVCSSTLNFIGSDLHVVLCRICIVLCAPQKLDSTNMNCSI